MDTYVLSTPDMKRHMLRHAVATLAYRGGKAINDAPDGFGTLRLGEETRSPGEILAHIGDLLEWALWLAKGKHEWHDSAPLPWNDEVARFFNGLRELDLYLASGETVCAQVERLFQGPIADALTHVGQIALMRRLAGSPILGENYFKAEIAPGQVAREQPAPRLEFE
jgi:hypothetical protein